MVQHCAHRVTTYNLHKNCVGVFYQCMFLSQLTAVTVIYFFLSLSIYQNHPKSIASWLNTSRNKPNQCTTCWSLMGTRKPEAVLLLPEPKRNQVDAIHLKYRTVHLVQCSHLLQTVCEIFVVLYAGVHKSEFKSSVRKNCSGSRTCRKEEAQLHVWQLPFVWIPVGGGGGGN